MPPTTSASRGPIQLHYDGGQVVVTPDDQDRFVMASRQAVSACQNALAVTRLVEQFKTELLGRLHQWCAQNAGQVQSGYVPFLESGSCIKVFMVAKSAKFDFALSDAIADLEVALDEAGWPCEVLQIASGAAEDLQVFFDPEHSIQVFGNGDNGPASG